MKTYENSKKLSENIIRRLEEIESNPSRGDDMRKTLISNIFNEIIQNDQVFGDALRKIKRFYDSQTESVVTIKGQLAAAKKEKAQLAAAKEGLAAELTISRADNVATKKLLKDSLSETKKLREEVEDLKKRLKQAKNRESMLASWLKGERVSGNSPEKEPIEVGKNKVKVPRLDLAKMRKMMEEEEAAEAAVAVEVAAENANGEEEEVKEVGDESSSFMKSSIDGIVIDDGIALAEDLNYRKKGKQLEDVNKGGFGKLATP